MVELTEQLGREIIERLSPYIEVPINLMDPDGRIVASSDTSRVGQLHGGAQEVIERVESQMITEMDVNQFFNTKPGVNVPIFHRDQLAGVVGLTGHPKDVMQAAGMTRGSVEIALEQIYIQKQVFFQERQWNDWLHQLLRPGLIDSKDLEREAAYTLHIDVHNRWQVIVFQTDDHFELTEQVRSVLEKQHIEPLFVLPYQEKSVVVALPVKDLTSLENSLANRLSDVKVGVGEAAYGISGIQQSYLQAQEVIEIAGVRGDWIYSESLEMERLLHHIDLETYTEITTVYKSRLYQLESSYIETLNCYFASNLKMNRTAADMHIHRNTLIYRLDQISKKVELDPRVFKDAVLLQTILINK